MQISYIICIPVLFVRAYFQSLNSAFNCRIKIFSRGFGTYAEWYIKYALIPHGAFTTGISTHSELYDISEKRFIITVE